MRTGINKSAVHTVYIVLFQYRKLAESLMEYAREFRVAHFQNLHVSPNNRNFTLSLLLEQRVMHIAKYMRYYASLCQVTPSIPQFY